MSRYQHVRTGGFVACGPTLSTPSLHCGVAGESFGVRSDRVHAWGVRGVVSYARRHSLQPPHRESGRSRSPACSGDMVTRTATRTPRACGTPSLARRSPRHGGDSTTSLAHRLAAYRRPTAKPPRLPHPIRPLPPSRQATIGPLYKGGAEQKGQERRPPAADSD